MKGRLVLGIDFGWLAIVGFTAVTTLPGTWWMYTHGHDLLGLRGIPLVVTGAFSSVGLLYMFFLLWTGSLELTAEGIRRSSGLRFGGRAFHRPELWVRWEDVRAVTGVAREGALKLSGVVVRAASGEQVVVSSLWASYYRAVAYIAQRVPDKLTEEAQREAQKAEALVSRERDLERTSS